MCEVCFGDLGSSTSSSLACGHYFCGDCWRSHVSTSLHETLAGRCVLSDVRCMMEGCGLAVTETAFQRWLDVDGRGEWVGGWSC